MLATSEQDDAKLGEIASNSNLGMSNEVVVEHASDEDGKPTPSQVKSKSKLPRFLDFPWPVKLIILNEVCERFSYYGTRALLTLFMNNRLGYDEDASVALPSIFSSVAYFLPLFGGYIADAYLGQYIAIMLGSSVYVSSSVILVFSSWMRSRVLLFVSLALAALGTGFIKPCVSVFGAAQLSEEAVASNAKRRADPSATQTEVETVPLQTSPQEKRKHAEQLETFFYTFYFVINIGSVLSLLAMPLIRTHMSYTVAFIVPAVLNGLAFFFFWLGRRYYYQPKGLRSPIKDVWNVVRAALAMTCCGRLCACCNNDSLLEVGHSELDASFHDHHDDTPDANGLDGSPQQFDERQIKRITSVESKTTSDDIKISLDNRVGWWNLSAKADRGVEAATSTCCGARDVDGAPTHQEKTEGVSSRKTSERTPLLRQNSVDGHDQAASTNVLNRKRTQPNRHQCISSVCFCAPECPCRHMSFNLALAENGNGSLPGDVSTLGFSSEMDHSVVPQVSKSVRPHMRGMRQLILNAANAEENPIVSSEDQTPPNEYVEISASAAWTHSSFQSSCCCIQRVLVERQLSQLVRTGQLEISGSSSQYLPHNKLPPKSNPPMKWLDRAVNALDRYHSADAALVTKYLRKHQATRSQPTDGEDTFTARLDSSPQNVIPPSVLARFGAYVDAREVRRLEIKHTRRILMLVVLFSTLPVFWCLTAQQGSTWVLQAREMSRRVKVFHYTIEPEQMQLLNPIFLFILLPIFDWFFRCTGKAWAMVTAIDKDGVGKSISTKIRILGAIHMHPLSRVILGMLFAAASYCVAAMVDFKIHNEAHSQYPLPPNTNLIPTVSILWQIPQYFLITVAEVLVSVTFNKYTVDMSPPHMKSLAMAFLMASSSIGDFLTGLLYLCLGDVSRRYLFFGLAGLVTINAIYFFGISQYFMNYLDYEVEEDDFLLACIREAFTRAPAAEVQVEASSHQSNTID